jgi:hypothetical protein
MMLAHRRWGRGRKVTRAADPTFLAATKNHQRNVPSPADPEKKMAERMNLSARGLRRGEVAR